jgi:hypothetical protein
MTFLERLHTHIGGLVHMKFGLYWYSSCSCDEITGRICLLLDVACASASQTSRIHPNAASIGRCGNPVFALLLIDGSSKWVLISEDAVELIQ